MQCPAAASSYLLRGSARSPAPPELKRSLGQADKGAQYLPEVLADSGLTGSRTITVAYRGQANFSELRQSEVRGESPIGERQALWSCTLGSLPSVSKAQK